MLAALIDGMNDGGTNQGAGAAGVRRTENGDGENRNGSNMSTVLGVIEMCWGLDTGLTLTMPRQGLGNSAIASVADDKQLERFDWKWAAMAITEPEAGSDSAAIRTTAVLDEETGEYVLNGEKIFVTSGDRADLIVVWASLDPKQGRAAIKSFVVERDNPGLKLDRLEHKLGIKASDTANFVLTDCRVPPENLLGTPEIDMKKSFGGAMQTFDNTRPLGRGWPSASPVPASSAPKSCSPRPGSRSTTTGRQCCRRRRRPSCSSSRPITRPRTCSPSRRRGWPTTTSRTRSTPPMRRRRPGRSATDIALRCVALCGSLGYGEDELLEKWARDAKILDIFEGTQQIQLLIIARTLLGKSSAELKEPQRAIAVPTKEDL